MRLLFSLLLHCSLYVASRGQTVPIDTVKQTGPVASARMAYNQLGTTRERLANGPEYIPHSPRTRGYPYFATDTWNPARLHDDLDGSVTLPVLYDLVRDVVLTEHRTGYRFAIRSELIRSFVLLNHTFVRMTDSSRGLETGFYDRLYDGPSQLLARRVKTLQRESLGNGRSYGEFIAKTKYYVRRQNQYYPVTNKRTLLAVFNDRRKALLAYARQQKLRFRPNPEPAIQKLTQYYDELGPAL